MQGRARAGERGGRGREGEREEGRGGAHLGIQLRRFLTPNPRAPRDGERERWGREVAAWEIQMRERREEGAPGRVWAPGARRAGLGWVGSSWVGSSHFVDRNLRHARPSNGFQSRIEIRDGTRRTRNIKQRNALRHEATSMTLRFCSYTTRTPITILV
jgi:hypothetical protein